MSLQTNYCKAFEENNVNPKKHDQNPHGIYKFALLENELQS